MRRKRKIYNYIDDRKYLELSPDWPDDEDAEDRALYSLGHIKVPRSMLMDEKWQALKPSSRSVYLHLMMKEEAIRQKRKALIDDIETEQKEGIVVASTGEIESYTGIRADKIKAYRDELVSAGLVKSKQITEEKNVVTTKWQLAKWPIGKAGYVKVPLAVMISPAWQYFSHDTRLLYIALLSESCSAKKKKKQKFPEVMIAYSQICAKYGLSKSTIRPMQGEQDKENKKKRARKSESGHAKTGIRALEEARMILYHPGEKLDDDLEIDGKIVVIHGKRAINKYWILTDFMFKPQEITTTTTTESSDDTVE